MSRRFAMVLSVAFLVLFVASAPADVFNMPDGQTSLQFVTVGDPGNAADMATGSLYGSVPYVYQIGKYDVTVGQYCQFLNAVAKTDTYGLYNSYMAPTSGNPWSTNSMPTIGITQTGSSGDYSYSVTGTYSQGVNCPIFDVSWGDAARFCNWLQDQQPTGAEGPGTTETGAYTLNGATSSSALMAITRNAGATDFIPNENEWYKAAYYKGASNNADYWTYPTQSNHTPGNTLPDVGNSANYWNGDYTDPTNWLTPVGAFSNSSGAYGTFDMGGDVWQLNETAVDSSSRGLRGGYWSGYFSDGLPASYRQGADPTFEDNGVGFRVASVPEPGSLIMLFGFAVTALLYYCGKHA